MAIVINLSEEAANSESFDNTPIPAGKYLVVCSNAELEEVKHGQNKGKPMMALEFTVEEDARGTGDYNGRKIYTRVMLFGEKNFSAAWIMKAMGLPVTAGQVGFPEPEEIMGERFVVRVVISPPRTVTNPETGEQTTYEARNEIRGYWAASEWDKHKKSGAGKLTEPRTSRSLLP